MEIIQISFDQTDIEIGSLGMQGENKKVALHVDCSSVLESHPNATIIINYDRRFPGESYYNLPVTALENGIFETVLTPMEMAYDGLKYIQVRAVECDYEDRSKRFIAYVEKSVYDFRPPSGPVSDWLDQLRDALAKADAAQQHGPVIGENGNWYVWQDGYYVDTGVKAGNDVSDEMIAQAVSDYLAANPISETDPTVSDWAKQPNKPTYTADEVGALPSSTMIPGALSDLTEDTTHRTVTDAEKEVWNAKSDFSGSYNDLSDQPTIPEAYTLPVANAETLGGVKPVAKTEDMTQSVGVDALGGLWALPGGGSSGGAVTDIVIVDYESTEEIATINILLTDEQCAELQECDEVYVQMIPGIPAEQTERGNLRMGIYGNYYWQTNFLVQTDNVLPTSSQNATYINEQNVMVWLKKTNLLLENNEGVSCVALKRYATSDVNGTYTHINNTVEGVGMQIARHNDTYFKALTTTSGCVFGVGTKIKMVTRRYNA